MKRALREQRTLYNANVVLIEDEAPRTQLIQELIIDGSSGRGARSNSCAPGWGAPVVTELEQLTGVETRRIHVDKGYFELGRFEQHVARTAERLRLVPRGVRPIGAPYGGGFAVTSVGRASEGACGA